MSNIKDAGGLLSEIDEAITKVVSGAQSYKIGSRQLTRADLKELYAIRNDLLAQANAGQDGFLDNTYVAVFDTR